MKENLRLKEVDTASRTRRPAYVSVRSRDEYVKWEKRRDLQV